MFFNLLFAFATATTLNTTTPTTTTTTTPTSDAVTVQTQTSENGIFYKNNANTLNLNSYNRVVVQSADEVIVSNPFVLHTFEAATTSTGNELMPEGIEQERVPIINGLEDF